MRAVLQHRPRCADRAADMAEPSDRTRTQIGAVHHGGIEFVRFGMGEYRAVACIKKWAVFQQFHRMADRIQRAGALQ